VNLQDPEVPNTEEVEPPQGDFTNLELTNAIQTVTQVMANQDSKQRGVRQYMDDKSRIREFFRMNSPELTGSNITEDPEKFVEVLQKVLCMLPMLSVWS